MWIDLTVERLHTLKRLTNKVKTIAYECGGRNTQSVPKKKNSHALALQRIQNSGYKEAKYHNNCKHCQLIIKLQKTK